MTAEMLDPDVDAVQPFKVADVQGGAGLGVATKDVC